MCGIHAIISSSPSQPLSAHLKAQLCSRGPDHSGTVTSQLPNASLTFTSTVLALRGDHIAKQPLVDEATGSVLCWNGEAWSIKGQKLEMNDTDAVFELLAQASRRRVEGDADPVLEALRGVEGPFAFAFFDKLANRVYFGRDRLGRRSLLMNCDGSLTMSSIAETTSDAWSEVEADGCYYVSLDQIKDDWKPEVIRLAWTEEEDLVSSIGAFNMTLPESPPSLSLESASVKQLHEHLVSSLQHRVLSIPLPPSAGAEDARVAILFSGGLDCTVVARLASDLVPAEQPIDLINVAFENPRIAAQNASLSQDELYELCPDRVTGRKSFAELMAACPNRHWRLVAVNVPYKETCEHRSDIIRLIHPHNTEMDLSIANALYFAARGQGLAVTSLDSSPQPCRTTARVLVSGLGADELFGGYQRHNTSHSRKGYPGLIDELKLDVSRLGKRNLGRDDRAMAHWGREVRFPFLDENLVKWAIELPAWEKCDFGNPVSDNGLDPEKRVLRLLALSLGLSSVASEKKRAIQFGARTAKMESGKVKGTTSITP